MFERILISQQRQNDPANPLDAGALVEAMLFYGETQLIVSPAVVAHLARLWTPEGLIEMAEEGFLKLTFRARHVGIRTHTNASGEARHHPTVFSVHQSPDSPRVGMERFVPTQFEAILGRRGRARRLANRFYRLVTPVELDDSLADRVRQDLLDSAFIERVASKLLELLVPEYSPSAAFRFEVSDSDAGLMVSTSIDFVRANLLYHTRVPVSHSSLSPEYLLAHVIAARDALEAAAIQDADIATDPTHALVGITKLETVLRRTKGNDATLQSFQHFVFDDARALRGAVNSGTRSVTEIIDLLKNARRFRGWLHGQAPQGDLIKQYFRDCTRETWVDKLPVKSVRWLLFTGFGVALDAMGTGGLGTLAGLTVSAGDAFFLDKVVRGWRPSQFVEKDLRAFLQPPR